MTRQAPPVLESGMVGGADDCDLLRERARRGLDRAQRGYAGGGPGVGAGGREPPGRAQRAVAVPAGRGEVTGRGPGGGVPMQKARAVSGLWGWVRGWRRVRRGLCLRAWAGAPAWAGLAVASAWQTAGVATRRPGPQSAGRA